MESRLHTTELIFLFVTPNCDTLETTCKLHKMLRMNYSYLWAWGTYAKTMKFHGHKNKTSVQEFKGKKVLTFAIKPQCSTS